MLIFVEIKTGADDTALLKTEKDVYTKNIERL